jgi:hypothetical protein
MFTGTNFFFYIHRRWYQNKVHVELEQSLQLANIIFIQYHYSAAHKETYPVSRFSTHLDHGHDMRKRNVVVEHFDKFKQLCVEHLNINVFGWCQLVRM